MSALLAAAGMAQRLTILVVLLRTAHALVCRAPAMAAAPTRTSAVLMADVAPDHEEKVAKALKAMTGFANSYCKNTGTTYCEDLSIPAVRYSLGISSSQAHTHTRPSARSHSATRSAAGGAQRVGGAQGDAGRPTLPVPALRGQGGGGQGRLLELSLRAHARAARLPLHVHRSRAPATTWGAPCPHTPGTPRLSKACVRRLFLTEDNEFAGPENHVDVAEVKRITDGMSIL